MEEEEEEEEGVGLLCMNGKCASSSSSSNSNSVQWKKGWPLRSPAFGFATLCHNCGSAYEQLSFCEMFHSEESGWRDCSSCGKRLHCGCVASSSLLDLLDTGGVICKSCSSNSSKLLSTMSEEKHKAHGLSTENGINLDFEKLLPTKPGDDGDNQENGLTGSGEIRFNLLSSFSNSPTGPSNDYDPLQESRGILTSSVPTDLCISLSASSNQNTFSGLNAEESQLSIGMSSFQVGSSRPRHLLPRLPNSILATAGLQTNSSSISQLRIARPPVEGRVKNQLLPRYWPRITDQELQQISGDSNSTIVPLFEKVLSASDAGRIGRLVLPKACAEAYFPPISQPEGLPLRIQDVKGKEWVFQFRFWPNNNSRMYVLEGVTPCIQSMQLQAGDTVTFSRMDPEGKLLMGFRKASKHNSIQKDTHYNFQSEPLLGNAESLPIMGGYTGFLHSLKGSGGSYLGNASKLGDNLVPQSMLGGSDRKRRNIGPKSKRLAIDGHDSMELTLSWEEIQDMLRPPPSAEPSTLSVEDHEFEEFDEPPVFGKKSIFTVRLSGEQEQWTQCDSCFKWRKVPIDMLLPPKWNCQDNINDRAGYSCSAPDELSSRELDNLLKMNNDFTKLRFPASFKPALRHDSLDHEEIVSDQGASSVATTTKHPRHRPGCSCIVCIQPPSGKGKHKPTCTCNVCMTVKRRFKTLMMRKKKRQSDREAEIAQRNQTAPPAVAAKEDTEVDNPKGAESGVLLRCQSEHRAQENAENFQGRLLDLNFCPPGRENTAKSRLSMMSLLQEASLPLEIYLRRNGLTSLVSEPQATSPLGENIPMDQAQEEGGISTAVVQKQGEVSDEFSEKDQRENDQE